MLPELGKSSIYAINPASDLDVVAAPKPPVTNNPFLRLPELADLQNAINGYGVALQTRLGPCSFLRFLPIKPFAGARHT